MDRVIVIENLKRDYILGQVLHRHNRFGTGYSTNSMHYITLNREMIAKSCLQLPTNPILKTKGTIKLLPSYISVIEARTPEIPDPSNVYELDFNTLQLPKGVIPLDIMHHVDHKMPKTLTVPILNINNIIFKSGKNSPMTTLVPAGKCEQVQEVKWSEVTQEPELTNNPKSLPDIPCATNLQLEPNTNDVVKSIPDAVIPNVTRRRLHQLLDIKYNSIVS